MPPTPMRLLADTLLPDGDVTDFITERRDAGASWRRIALDLRDATDGRVDVTPETIRKWASALAAAA